jgi:hypothetical protein
VVDGARPAEPAPPHRAGRVGARGRQLALALVGVLGVDPVGDRLDPDAARVVGVEVQLRVREQARQLAA